ncbi:MAG: flagellar FliJ family protein [Planctomycetes bacterium]|nr:flagellar FliJ family protein [Planctomycetota bacterium]
MKRFRFGLEQVLKLREKLHDQVLGEFRGALAKEQQKKEQWLSLIRERQEAQGLLRKERTKPVMQALRILVLQESLELLEKEIVQARRFHEAARAEVERIRVKLTQSKRGVEMLKRIKARHLKRYQAGIRAEEMKEINEIAVTRFVRNGSAVEGSMMGDREDA